MPIADIDDRHPAGRVGRHPSSARELSVSSSFAICLLAAILVGIVGWIGFEILLTLVTLD
jgi:hypothetical protein